MELIIRFVVGGAVVSVFAMLGGALKPKSFAGLLSAAPSVALATLSLTAFKKGNHYAALEAYSMILGSVAFFVYALLVSGSLMKKKAAVLPVTAMMLLIWFACAFALHFLII